MRICKLEKCLAIRGAAGRMTALCPAALLVVYFVTAASAVEMTWEYSVQVSARVQTNPPAIFFSWPQDQASLPDFYTVSRKAPHETSWGDPVHLPGTATNYVDTNVIPAVAYEYQFFKRTSNYVGYGYITAGMLLPFLDDRGKVILLVDNICAEPLAHELRRLHEDLEGDGWTVLRHDVARNASVPQVKALIRANYDADPTRVKALFLFGRVPVPYSGNTAPDGHFLTHAGAWPADAFYGDMDGEWTDTLVTDLTSVFPNNHNVPGDGKYDQAEIPGTVMLQIGRVDLSNMPGLETNGLPTFPGEIALLRQYLEKDHRYRHKKISLQPRGLIYNLVGDRAGEAFAASAWRNWAPLLGPPSVRPLQTGEFMPILRTNAYLWAYAASGGAPAEMGGLGGSRSFYYHQSATTLDVVEMDIQAAFVMLLASSIGDWDLPDNFMRAVLATPSYGLATVYAGRPHWFFHPMGLGETLGYCARLTQNNHAEGLYRNHSNNFAGFAHIALLGDPTLRHHVLAPPGQLTASLQNGSVLLKWPSSREPVDGYHIYRRPGPATGPFTRVSSHLLTAEHFLDVVPNHGDWTYMVRAVKLEETPSGTYFNLSQGAFVHIRVWPVLTIGGSPANVHLSWNATPGKVYNLFTTHSLANQNWEPLDPWIIATSERVSLLVDTAHATSGSGWMATNSMQRWLDEKLPAGAVCIEGSWNWISNNPAPYSGQRSLESPLGTNFHQQYFTNALPLSLKPGDVLSAHVYLDPENPPAAIMLQWYDGASWEHRAFWGANLFHFGELGTAGRVDKGPLPPAGEWTALQVPAEELDLVGARVSGMAFGLYHGRAAWDQVGKKSSASQATTPPTQRFFKLIQLP